MVTVPSVDGAKTAWIVAPEAGAFTRVPTTTPLTRNSAQWRGEASSVTVPVSCASLPTTRPLTGWIVATGGWFGATVYCRVSLALVPSPSTAVPTTETIDCAGMVKAWQIWRHRVPHDVAGPANA